MDDCSEELQVIIANAAALVITLTTLPETPWTMAFSPDFSADHSQPLHCCTPLSPRQQQLLPAIPFPPDGLLSLL